MYPAGLSDTQQRVQSKWSPARDRAPRSFSICFQSADCNSALGCFDCRSSFDTSIAQSDRFDARERERAGTAGHEFGQFASRVYRIYIRRDAGANGSIHIHEAKMLINNIIPHHCSRRASERAWSVQWYNYGDAERERGRSIFVRTLVGNLQARAVMVVVVVVVDCCPSFYDECRRWCFCRGFLSGEGYVGLKGMAFVFSREVFWWFEVLLTGRTKFTRKFLYMILGIIRYFYIK